MQLRNRALATQGLLCLMAFTVASGTMAVAMEPVLDQTSVLALAGPLSSQDKGSQDKPDTSQPDQSAAKSVVVTGMIAKSGSNFILRDSTGTVYQLDAPDKAQPFEGKSVKVTGRLEAETKLLHVETIEKLNA
jgi:hypothetical protein